MNFFGIIELLTREDIFGREKGFIELYQDYMRVVENIDPPITKCLKHIAYHVVNDEPNLNLYHYARTIDFQSIMNVIIIYDNIRQNHGYNLCLFGSREYADVQAKKINQYLQSVDSLKKSQYHNNILRLWENNILDFAVNINRGRGRTISNLYICNVESFKNKYEYETFEEYKSVLCPMFDKKTNIRISGSLISRDSIFREMWENEDSANKLRFTWRHGPIKSMDGINNMRKMLGKIFYYEYECKFIESR